MAKTLGKYFSIASIMCYSAVSYPLRKIQMTVRRLLALPLLMALASLSFAQGNSVSGKPSWTSNPGAQRESNGSYPAKVNVVLFLNACTRDASGAVVSPLDPSDVYRITPTGAGIQAEVIQVGPCQLTSTITITPEISQPGYQYLMVSKQTKGSGPFLDVGFSRFGLLDPLAGPTPSTPEVDVQWIVLSQHACADAFGNHVAKVFYCVQVTIGNNSAYTMQLAGIGFKTPNPLAGVLGVSSDASLIEPNISYQVSRAVAQNGQSTTFRNILVNGVQGIGLIMSSFTPYFRNPFNVSRWSTGSAIVSGAFVQAMNLVAPDLTIRELNNLDDAALRDGKVIPNNTQAPPVMVFVDKMDVRDSLATLETNVKGITSPTIGQQTLLKDLDNCVQKQTCGPIPVKLALGHIVIVGDQIDYIQRVVVDSSGSAAQVPVPPLITSTSGLTVASGQLTNLQLTGTGLDQISTITLDAASVSAKITTGSLSLSGTTGLTVPITVPSAYHGSITLNFTSTIGSVAPITVTVP
jgi:hypothetical protein